MEDQLPRKLAAILYADVADYSRLTGEDEEATHRRLSEYLDLASENKRSWHQDKQLLDRSIPNSWASRAVTSITSRDIGDLLDAKRDPPPRSNLKSYLTVNDERFVQPPPIR